MKGVNYDYAPEIRRAKEIQNFRFKRNFSIIATATLIGLYTLTNWAITGQRQAQERVDNNLQRYYAKIEKADSLYNEGEDSSALQIYKQVREGLIELYIHTQRDTDGGLTSNTKGIDSTLLTVKQKIESLDSQL